MRYLLPVNKILMMMISWVLVFAPIAYNQSVYADSSQTDPNWCYNDDSYTDKMSNCSKQTDDNGAALVYNCSLDICAGGADNNMYNEEYSDCSTDACRQNIIDAGIQVRDHNTEMENTQGDVGSGDGMSDAGDWVYSLASVGILACSMIDAFQGGMDAINSCFSGKWGKFVTILAALFIMMFKGEVEGDMKAAVESMKATAEMRNKPGFNVNIQISALETEIQTLKDLEDAIEKKITNHWIVLSLSAIIAIFVIIDIIKCYTGDCNGWCIGVAAALAVYGIIAEGIAISNSEDSLDSVRKSKRTAEELKRKLDGLFSIDNPSVTIENPDIEVPGNQNPQVGGSVITGGEGDFSNPTNDSGLCAGPTGDPVPCGPEQETFVMGNLPNDSATQQVNDALKVEELIKEGNKAFKGENYNFGGTGSEKGFAVATKIRRKIAEKAKKLLLSKKGKIKGVDKFVKTIDDMESQINSGKLTNQTRSPARVAALLSRYSPKGMDLGNKKEVEVKEKGAAPTGVKAVGGAGFDMNALQARLKALQQDLDLGNIKGMQDAGNNNLDEVKLKKDEEYDVDATAKSINPNRKISIFKIISNRYNIMRIKKRIGQ